MGYTVHCGATRAELIKSLLSDCNWSTENSTVTLVAHACVGNDLWIILNSHKTDGTPDYKTAVVCAMSGGKDGWGYRDMDESVGPYKWNIPAKLFKMLDTPPVNQYAADWRAKVQAILEKPKPVIGSVVKFQEGTIPPQVTIVSTRPMLGVYGGTRYKVTRKLLASADIIMPS